MEVRDRPFADSYSVLRNRLSNAARATFFVAARKTEPDRGTKRAAGPVNRSPDRPFADCYSVLRNRLSNAARATFFAAARKTEPGSRDETRCWSRESKSAIGPLRTATQSCGTGYRTLPERRLHCAARGDSFRWNSLGFPPTGRNELRRALP